MPNKPRIIANSLIAIGVILSIAFGGMALIGATPTQHASHTIGSHHRVL
jgi:hypothetical protein